jgi:aspartyl-tRNA(Asn)/glutamyl-tRNA(Gln) amidotransferase subunit A
MSPQMDILSAAALIRAYRRREISPVEATRDALARIERLNPRYNAFCVVDPDAALRSAAQSEARWLKNEPLSFIDGVPTTIKDLVLTKGWPTLRGSRTVDTSQSWDEDAPATQRLREAGAVLLGKTTTPEFGWKGVCDSPLTGITRNPWNPEMTSGGSSGGAAVAAAFRLGLLHLGTDGGGSIRIPAAFSGVFGLKPTFGLVPAYPLSPFGTIAHLGPMTVTVEDAARMLTIMARPDSRDWHALPYAPHDFTVGLEDGVAGLKVAFSPALGHAAVDKEVAALVEAAVSRFVDAGARVELADPGFADPFETFRAHWYTGAANLRRHIPADRRQLLDPGFAAIADDGEQIPHMQYIAAVDARAAMGHRMCQFHETFDLLLTPTIPIAAFKAGQVAPPGTDQSNWMHWTPFSFPFNLTQQPAASIPCGFTTTGLPVGLQIVAAKYRDDLVLRAARAYETVDPIKTPQLPDSSASARDDGGDRT